MLSKFSIRSSSHLLVVGKQQIGALPPPTGKELSVSSLYFFPLNFFTCFYLAFLRLYYLLFSPVHPNLILDIIAPSCFFTYSFVQCRTITISFSFINNALEFSLPEVYRQINFFCDLVCQLLSSDS